MNPNIIYLSHATYLGPSGATAAATYGFMTSDYKPPSQDRHVEYDVVHNQNGKFKYLYDNGPGWRKWAPFAIRCEDTFQPLLGVGATAQYARLIELWNHPGILGMQTPDGTYSVHWAANELDKNFRVFPAQVTDKIEYEVVVQFEEGQAS